MPDPDWKLALLVLDAFADEDDDEVRALLDGVATARLHRVLRAMAATACMAIDELAQAQRVDFDVVLDSIKRLSAEFASQDQA